VGVVSEATVKITVALTEAEWLALHFARLLGGRSLRDIVGGSLLAAHGASVERAELAEMREILRKRFEKSTRKGASP
jgi:hypothetical protein